METSNPCLIHQQLTNIKASALSATELDLLFRFLKELLSNLVDNPFDENFKTISKDSEIFMNGSTRIQEVQDILTMLGFHEENEKYIHHLSDENLMKIESCLNLLNIFHTSQELFSPSSGLSDGEIQEGLDKSNVSKKARSLPDLSNQKARKDSEERSNEAVKKIILSKYLKKEETKERAFHLRSPVASSSEKEETLVTFNANGYFHQCGNSRNQKKDRSAMMDFFHRQDSRNKRWTVNGANKVI